MNRSSSRTGLAPQDFVLLARALVAAVRVEVGLRRSSLPELCRRLGVAFVQEARPVVVGERSPIASSPDVARRRRAAERVLHRWPFGATCLRRSLVLALLLHRLGPELRIGVAFSEGRLTAHAWLDVDGTALDMGAADFLPLAPVADTS